jgi:hypothetical protein
VFKTTEAWDQAVGAALVAGATLLGADLKAGLFTNNITPTNKTVIGDLVEPTYTGYARQTVVMGAVVRDPVQGIASFSAENTWQEITTPVSAVITGVFYTFGAGPALLGCYVFPTPIPLNDLLDFFATILEYIFTNENPATITVLQ